MKEDCVAWKRINNIKLPDLKMVLTAEPQKHGRAKRHAFMVTLFVTIPSRSLFLSMLVNSVIITQSAVFIILSNRWLPLFFKLVVFKSLFWWKVPWRQRKVVPNPHGVRGFVNDSRSRVCSLCFLSISWVSCGLPLFGMFSVKLCWIVCVLDLTLVSSALNERVNSASAFRFANIYGDHMVLQMKPFSAMVWGFGQIGEKVVVRLGSEAETTEVVKG